MSEHPNRAWFFFLIRKKQRVISPSFKNASNVLFFVFELWYHEASFNLRASLWVAMDASSNTGFDILTNENQLYLWRSQQQALLFCLLSLINRFAVKKGEMNYVYREYGNQTELRLRIKQLNPKNQQISIPVPSLIFVIYVFKLDEIPFECILKLILPFPTVHIKLFSWFLSWLTRFLIYLFAVCCVLTKLGV